MLNKATYTNHLNQTVEFGSDGLFLNDSELYDYEWLYDSDYDEITNFRKGVTKKNVTILIATAPEKGLAIRNRLYEVFDQDILSEEPGTLEVNGYKLSCYFNASKKSNYCLTNGYMIIEAGIISDSSNWITEKEFMFLKSEAAAKAADDKTKNHPYTYQYKYVTYTQSNSVVNPFFIACDFRLRIYGEVVNPSVSVGEHTYQVNVSVNEGERLEIDSNKRTITLIKGDGTTENHFWDSNKDSYIFEKIPTGESSIGYDGTFGFDLILLGMRGEPEW